MHALDADGRWLISVGAISAFVKTAKVPNCPQLCAEPYAGVAHTSVRPAAAIEFCLFFGAAIALARMRHHVAVHLQKGEVATDPRMHGEAEPCDFCGRTTGTCTTSTTSVLCAGKSVAHAITLKVAQAVDNEGASFSEPSLGRSDWEWKSKEDASSAESRSSAVHDSSSDTESAASSEDGNSSSSSSSSSSSTSSSGVEVLPKKKAVPGKGTKRPITTPKQSAKKRHTVQTPGRKK